MKYRTRNIGDEIQSIAASRFLPRIDEYIFREHLDSFYQDSGVTFKMILNGWFMDCPQHFPPSENIAPLLISMHFQRSIRSVIVGSKKVVKYFREHGPVGCRDTDTMHFLLENGIPAYHSGCLTLTLTENKALKASHGGKYVLCVDVPDNVVEYVRNTANKTVYNITKSSYSFLDAIDRLELAKVYLYMYHNASAVVTSNLHTALPCLAFNVPVCLIEQEVDDGRFHGLDTLLNHCNQSDFIADRVYDVNNPPANPQGFTKFRDSLIDTCRTFTGYDSGQPTLDDDYSPYFLRILQMMRYNPALEESVMFDLSGKKLLKIALIKAWHKFFRWIR